MKKIAVMGLICACVTSAYAGDCKEVDLKFKGNQDKSDNEFLYTSKDHYDFGIGYECDNEYCQKGTTITMYSGHYFEGKKINETRTYKCKLGAFDDKWEVVSKKDEGQIKTTRWCNELTSSTGEKNRGVFNLTSWTDAYFHRGADKDFDAVAKNLFNKKELEYVQGFRAICTKDGWKLDEVRECSGAYVHCKNHCKHYKDIIAGSEKKGKSVDYEEMYKAFAVVSPKLKKSDYDKFVSGKMSDEDVAKKIFIGNDLKWVFKDYADPVNNCGTN